MRIVTYNAASIRARLPRLLEWMEEHEPDVIAIQETKVVDDLFPRDEFENLGYECAIHGQKSYNGVAILSRRPISNVRYGFGDDLWPNDCRIISADIEGIEVINTYVPNGSSVGSDKFAYKMEWLLRFRRFLDERYKSDQPLIWLGDVNIAPEPRDVYDSAKVLGGVGHHPEEFVRLRKILEFGLTDVFRQVVPEGGHYTFWEFTIPNALKRGVGWRIDHVYATQPLLPLVKHAWIDYDARTLEKPSDHTFMVAEFDL